MTPLPVPRLLVWRHGRTEWNATGRFQGQLDPPLDAQGRRQAAAAAAHLAADGLPADATVVVSSDLDRARSTATALTEALGVPLRLDPRLREHGMGSWEGLTRQEVADRYPEQYADWLAGHPVRGRGGEDVAEVPRRALAALRDLPEAQVAVVVTHGGTAARLMEALLGLGPEHRRLFGPLANCAWSELAFQSERWRLLRHNTAAPPLPDPAPGGTPGRGPLQAGASPEEGAAGAVQDADAVT
ncbi:histidine phosphatase family protein [Geodermatophilus sp. SYSU D00758]